MNTSIAAVVVTYNRKQLLTECLDALLNQSRLVNKIILIDNASTDGTRQSLQERGYLDNSVIEYVRLPKNIGGAGGFHEGVKYGYEAGYDWLWLMDDDTVCQKNALENLIKASIIPDTNVGFVCSKVLWINGQVHLMNMPAIPNLVNNIAFNQYDKDSKYIVAASSFVSCLISKNAIKKIGLPLKEMFIWSDDIEYTYRITNNKYIGVYAKDSIVIHKTKDNYYSNIVIDSSKNFWKYKYGIRNDIYTKRVYSGFTRTAIYSISRLLLVNYRILRYREDKKFKAIYINTTATINGYIFNPKVKFSDKK